MDSGFFFVIWKFALIFYYTLYVYIQPLSLLKVARAQFFFMLNSVKAAKYGSGWEKNQRPKVLRNCKEVNQGGWQMTLFFHSSCSSFLSVCICDNPPPCQKEMGSDLWEGFPGNAFQSSRGSRARLPNGQGPGPSACIRTLLFPFATWEGNPGQGCSSHCFYSFSRSTNIYWSPAMCLHCAASGNPGVNQTYTV